MKHWEAVKTKDGFAIKEQGLAEKGFSDRIAEVNEYLKEREANAKLIAAAPELLEACKKSISNISQLCTMVNNYSQKLGLGKKVNESDFTEMIVSAIQKATTN